jgi:hypothetical protein
MLLMLLVADRTVIERQIERYNMLNMLYLKNEFCAIVYNDKIYLDYTDEKVGL